MSCHHNSPPWVAKLAAITRGKCSGLSNRNSIFHTGSNCSGGSPVPSMTRQAAISPAVARIQSGDSTRPGNTTSAAVRQRPGSGFVRSSGTASSARNTSCGGLLNTHKVIHIARSPRRAAPPHFSARNAKALVSSVSATVAPSAPMTVRP
jgi:hypothetical protein